MNGAFGSTNELRNIRGGEPLLARTATAQNRALRQLLSISGEGVSMVGGTLTIIPPPADRHVYKLIRILEVDDTLGEPFYEWEEVRIAYDGDELAYLPAAIDGGASSETHGPAYVVGAVPTGAIWARRMLALDGTAMWHVAGGPMFVRGRITAVSGSDGDNAGAVFYDAESDDGAIVLIDRQPVFRAYGDEVPVNVAEVDSTCLIMVGEDGQDIAFSLETFATETCDGEAAYVFGFGAGNGIDMDLVLIASDGTPAVSGGGNLLVSPAATIGQSAAFDRVAVGADSAVLADAIGVALVTYDGSVFVHPSAFWAMMFSPAAVVMLDVGGDRLAASPMIARGVAEAMVRSTRSEVVRFEAFREAGAPTPIIVGSRGGNVALANLLSALNSLGIITDNTTA